MAGSIQFTEFFFQLLGLIGAHDTGIVHQVGGNAQFGEFACSSSISYCQAEYVVFRVGRIIHLRAVIQLFRLHITEIYELFVYLSDRHALELSSVKRLFANRRFDRLVFGLLQFAFFACLTFFDVECQIIIGQILFGYTLDVIVGDGHNFIFVVKHFAQILLIGESFQQHFGFRFVVFHHQVEVTAHIVLDGIDCPVCEVSVGNLFNGFQCLLLCTFV